MGKDEMTFEQAIARLEEIVKTLESGSAELDASLTLFEEGTRLVKLCNAKLDSAQQKVKLLTMTPDGVIETDMPKTEQAV